MPDPTFLAVWDASWRVPNLVMFPIGFIIVGWALVSGFHAFRGSQSSGQPEIHFPGQEPFVVDEGEDETPEQ